MDRKSHWDRVYETKKPDTVSWYEHSPSRSLGYIQRYSEASHRVMDVGAGASLLTGVLLDLGYANPIALDVSKAGLVHAQARLGDRAKLVTWIVADITKNPELPIVDLWHDRAVLHFLRDEADQGAYARLAARTVKGFAPRNCPHRPSESNESTSHGNRKRDTRIRDLVRQRRHDRVWLGSTVGALHEIRRGHFSSVRSNIRLSPRDTRRPKPVDLLLLRLQWPQALRPLARSAFVRAVLSNRRKFTSLTMLAWAGGLSPAIQALMACWWTASD